MDRTDIDLAKYGSRKFVVTLLGIIGAVGLAYISKMTPDVAIVLGAAIASYNWANSRMNNG